MEDGGKAAVASRSAALGEGGLLDLGPEEAFDRITRLAARTLKTRASLITLIDYARDRQVFLSQLGLPEALAGRRETPLAYSVCEHVVSTAAPLVIADARKDPRFKDNVAARALGLASYLGAPLRLDSGETIGALCVIDSKPRKWSDDDQALLAELAALAMREIALRRELRGRRIAEARLDESEEDFRVLASAIPQLAWMADGKGDIIWYNQRWFDYTGTTLEEMKGWGWKAVHHPDHVDRVVEKVTRCFETGMPWEDTFPLRGMDGEYRWFLSRALPRRDASGKITRWFGTNTDITDRLAAEERLTLLMREIDHRAKNALAVVQAVVRLSRADDAAKFQAAVEGRVAALARSHALLAQSRWEGADLGRLLRDELAPYIAERADRAVLEGPAHLLFPDTAQTMALVLHELATNAAKHGALSQEDGKLEVRWESTPDGGLSLSWVETLAQPVPRSKRTGFGTSLLAQSIERHLGGVYETELKKSGLVCRLSIPARPGAPAASKGEKKKKKEMQQKPKILLVEDDALISMEMEERLVDMGYDVLGPAATIEAAEQAIAASKPDLALLDANLRGRTTVELGVKLNADGVPVVFVTGYEQIAGLPAHMAGTPVLTKPISDDDLRATLQRLLPV